ncbi:hypothetical protein GCM10009552_15450 [Rothia nasimurium]|uniref:hypothetical protein n=1 Tax=Luteibacter anthropi TaxID=564369 RepID=UPI001ABB71E7|nr:hypothetical protein [Luteibacter anthropi]
MREVTERDMRDPKYGPGQPGEFEFREDGAIVRKDRWEMGIRRIADAVGALEQRQFEIADVVKRVEDMAHWLAKPERVDADEDEQEVPGHG